MGVLAPQYISNCWRGQSLTLVLSVDDYNVNLFDLASAQPNFIPGLPVDLYVRVEDGVTIGSTSTATKALRTGVFADGSLIHLVLAGLAEGMGGAGGRGSHSEAANGYDGLPGGDALHIETPTILDFEGGEIWSGGGGGGGGRHWYAYNGAGGGGGGAGSLPGAGGPHGGDINGGSIGSPGTATEGGLGGPLYTAGGKGGDPGEPGEAGSRYGTGSPAYAGGAAGMAITATAPLSIIGYGDLRGGVGIATWVTGAAIEDATPSKLTVSFSKVITSADYTGGIEITINDVPVTGLASATVSPSDTIEFTFSETVEYDDLVEWSYDAGTGDYVDADAFDVTSFSDAPVINSVEAPLVPPVITVQPANETVTEGEDADFSVTATGALGYQWYMDDEAIDGETSASLTLEAVALADTGAEIYVLVSNADGNTASDTVTLTVNEAIDPPVITVQPTNETVTEPAAADFAITATGADSYQWYMNDAVMEGQTANTLNTGPTVLADSGTEFYCIATNEGGNTQSDTVTLTVNAGSFSVASQTPNFGYNQQAGDGAHFFEASSGEIASIGTPTGADVADFTISFTDGVVKIVASGTNLPNGPYALTVPCYSGAGQTGDLVNVPVTTTPEANTMYVLPDDTELDAALDAIGVAGGKTVKIRNGAFTTGSMAGRGFLSLVTIAAENPVSGSTWNVSITAPDHDGTNFIGTDNLVVEGIEFFGTDFTGTFGEAIIKTHSNDAITFKQCHVQGIYRDPNGDYSAGFPGNFYAFHIVNPEAVKDIRIEECLIEDILSVGIIAYEGSANAFLNNIVLRYYGDGINLTDYNRGNPHGGAFVIEQNIFGQPFADPADAGGPHQDALLQIFHRMTGNWGGVKVNYNYFFIGDSRGRLVQVVFITTTDDGAGYYMEGMEIMGNVFLVDGTHAITANAVKDLRCIGNTCVKENPDGSDPQTTRIQVSGSSGNVVQNNICESFDLDGSVTASNNITLGLRGATIPYTDVFAGPTFQPANRAEMLTKYSMKANGPADVDDSGGPSLHDAGAVGTGYITWGDERGPSGWAVDTDYEAFGGGGGGGSPAVLASPTAVAAGIRSMTGTVSTDTLAGSTGLYQVTLPPGATAPDGDQVVAGTDGDDVAAAFASDQPVTATGVQDIAIDWLEPSTDYVTYYCHLTDEGPSNVVSASFTTATPVVRDTFVRDPYGVLDGTVPTVGIGGMEWLTVVGALTTSAPGKVASSAAGSFDASRLDTSVGGPDMEIYWTLNSGGGNGNFTYISGRADSAVDVDNYIYGGVSENGGDYYLELTEVVSGVSTEIGSVLLDAQPPAGTLVKMRLVGTDGVLSLSSEDAEIAVDDLNITTGNFVGPATGNTSGALDEITNFEVGLIS